MTSWRNLLPPSPEFYPLKQWYIPTRLHNITFNKEVTFRCNKVFTIPQKPNNCNQHTLIVPPHAGKKLNGYTRLTANAISLTYLLSLWILKQLFLFKKSMSLPCNKCVTICNIYSFHSKLKHYNPLMQSRLS
jgi:hypothetical protein